MSLRTNLRGLRSGGGRRRFRLELESPALKVLLAWLAGVYARKHGRGLDERRAVSEACLSGAAGELAVGRFGLHTPCAPAGAARVRVGNSWLWQRWCNRLHDDCAGPEDGGSCGGVAGLPCDAVRHRVLPSQALAVRGGKWLFV